jgi:hypothetical protein
MPMTANIIQIAKHTVKASVLITSTDACLCTSVDIALSFLFVADRLGNTDPLRYSPEAGVT